MTEIIEERIFYLEDIRAELDKENWEVFEHDDSQEIRRLFIGTVFDYLPSGKYYTWWARHNVTDEEVEKDQEWCEQAHRELQTIGCILINGENDCCDLFVCESRGRIGFNPNQIKLFEEEEE